MADRGNRLLRFIDLYAGVPLIWLLGLFRKKRLVPGSPKKVGILVTAAIGDTVIASAVIRDLRSSFTDCEITIFAGPTNSAMAEISCPYAKIAPIPVSSPVKAIKIIRSNGMFDLWIDFGAWPRINSLFSFFAKTKWAVGFKTRGQARHFVYDICAEHRNNCHEIDNYRSLAHTANAQSNSLPVITLQPKERVEKPFVIVHMFPGGYKSYYKEWSWENWVFVINKLTEKGINIVLTGSKDNALSADGLVKMINNPAMVKNRAGKDSLYKTCEILSQAKLVITVNTGIMHMAAALERPMIALHGPTSPLRWGPLSGKAVNFVSTSQSAGCLNLGFEYGSCEPNSLDTIKPEEVLAKSFSMF